MRRLRIGLVVLVMVGFFMGYGLWKYRKDRPLFHEWIGWDRPVWYPILPLADDSGTWFYVDPEANICVLIVAGDPSLSVFPKRASTSSATFVIGEEMTAQVEGKTNSLVLIIPGRRPETFDIEPGIARKWQEDLECIYRENGRNELSLIDEVLKRYRGKAEERLKNALAKNRKQ